MFCPNCGAQIPEGGKFCMTCGYRMAAEETLKPEGQPDGGSFFFTPPSLAEEPPKPVQMPPAAPQMPPVVRETSKPVQPVYEPPAYSTPAAAPAPKPPAKPRKQKKKWILPLILILLLVGCAVAVGIFLLWDGDIGLGGMPIDDTPQQFFLRTSEEIEDGETGIHYVEKLEYDDDGTLLEFSVRIEDDNEFGYLVERKITYEYDDGLLETVVIETGGVAYEIEFSYDDDVLESFSGMVPDGELSGICDSDGKVETIEIRNEAGELVRQIEYSYDDGILEEKVETVGNYVYTYRYENGKEVEILLEVGDEQVYRNIYEYNEAGYLIGETRYESGELVESVYFDCTYEDDRLSELVIVVEDAYGKTEIEGEVEWDDEEAEIILSGKNTEGDRIPDDTRLELEYDGDGNLLSAVVFVDDEQTLQHTYSYQEVEEPGESVPVDLYDPVWFIRLG